MCVVAYHGCTRSIYIYLGIPIYLFTIATQTMRGATRAAVPLSPHGRMGLLPCRLLAAPSSGCCPAMARAFALADFAVHDNDEPTHGTPSGATAEQLLAAQIGRHAPISTPLGVKPLVYADWTASARALAPVEAFLALLAEVRAAGSWKRYANEPRVQLIVLRKLAESGRAVATRGILTRLFAPRRRLMISALPDVLFWKILEFWRTDRDP